MQYIISISIPLWCDWKPGFVNSSGFDINFNSIMVRLEAFTLTPRWLYLPNFNSIMVRLEVILAASVQGTPSFQFHYGAIGSLKNRDKIKKHNNFNSIMVRLEVVIAFCVLNDYYIISIPLWCDWKNRKIRAIGISIVISIPLWCDWKIFAPAMFCSEHLHFNSIMVRLEVSLQVT